MLLNKSENWGNGLLLRNNPFPLFFSFGQIVPTVLLKNIETTFKLIVFKTTFIYLNYKF